MSGPAATSMRQGRALSREMLRLYRDKAREKRDVPPDIGTVFIGNNGKPMTNGCYFNISHSHGLVAWRRGGGPGGHRRGEDSPGIAPAFTHFIA